MNISASDLGLAFIYRNRSGYEGCTFFVKRTQHETISQKSNEYDEKKDRARRYPIVAFDNGGFTGIMEVNKDVFNIEYHFFNRITKRTAQSVGDWYIKNGLKFETIGYNCDKLIIKRVTFKN